MLKKSRSGIFEKKSNTRAIGSSEIIIKIIKYNEKHSHEHLNISNL